MEDFTAERPFGSFTPGPWKVDSQYGQDVQGPDGKDVSVSLCQDMHQLTFGMSSIGPLDRVTAFANARLIAAAPDLYELLEWALEYDGGVAYQSHDDSVGHHACCGNVSYTPHTSNCWVPRARATLAKVQAVNAPQERNV